jgi:hypothetical protein
MHRRDVTFHTSDSWSPYKSKGTQPNEDKENQVKTRDGALRLGALEGCTLG